MKLDKGRLRSEWETKSRNPWWRGAFVFLALAMLAVLCLFVAWLSGAGFRESPAWIITAVLIAAFGSLMRDHVTHWIARPYLRVVYEHREPYCDKAAFPPPNSNRLADKAQVFFIRLLVWNDGYATAKNVQAFVGDIRRWDEATKTFIPYRTLAMNLKWSYRPDDHVFDILAPGMHRYCDVGCVLEPRRRSEFDGDISGTDPDRILFSFETEFRTASKIHIVPPGAYLATISVAAENYRASSRTIKINVLGEWHPNMSIFLEKAVVVEPFEWKLY